MYRVSEKTPSSIRLEEAYFGLSCEVVTNSPGACLVCGQTNLWPLQNWLGRVDGKNSRYGTEEVPPPKETMDVSAVANLRRFRNVNGTPGSSGEGFYAGRPSPVVRRTERFLNRITRPLGCKSLSFFLRAAKP